MTRRRQPTPNQRGPRLDKTRDWKPFARFNGQARAVVTAAQAEARQLGHRRIGTEHILLRLLKGADEPGAVALSRLGIRYDTAREAVQQAVGSNSNSPVSGTIPFDDRAKKVLELSLREALALGDNFISSEHILLGLIHESPGLGARILREHGADARAVRDEVGRVRGAVS